MQSLICVSSAGLLGMDAYSVDVEVEVASGYVGYTVVGLPETAVRESRERVRAAIRQSGLKMPTHRITVNLTPAHLRKHGTAYDLPIALGVIQAGKPGLLTKLNDYLFAGELSFSGELRPIPGSVAMAQLAREKGYRGIVLPPSNLRQASRVPGIEVLGFKSLKDLCAFLTGREESMPIRSVQQSCQEIASSEDLSMVRGQEQAKRALMIAAAGGHNLMMIGVPGVGKSMLARCLPGLLPLLSEHEALEVYRIYTAAGMESDMLPFGRAPYRAPHHSCSRSALLGGGSNVLYPGEVTLAHHGVLFLDELSEFRRDALEGMRQPLEEHRVRLRRGVTCFDFPARFQMLAAMNPCPCGYFRDPSGRCQCSPHLVQSYVKKISGPFLDRVDIQLYVPPLSVDEISGNPSESMTSKVAKNKVIQARLRQRDRFPGEAVSLNAMLPFPVLERGLPESSRTLLRHIVSKWNMSMRGYGKLIRVARSIADLDDAEMVEDQHIAEAAQFRQIEKIWGV